MSNSKPVPEGTVIMAESQYAGRGQQQNRWNSEPGKNLTFSILLNPAFLQPIHQFLLTQAISLGVAGALQKILGDKVKIKWPNDIYFDDKKLGGILIESILHGAAIKHAVIGIGLNINQETFPDWVPNATSVKQILHTDYDLRSLLSDICGQIENRYLQLKNSAHDRIRNSYLAMLYGYEQPQYFEAEGQVFNGTIIGVSEIGRLQIQQADGLHEYNLKEVKFLHQQSHT